MKVVCLALIATVMLLLGTATAAAPAPSVWMPFATVDVSQWTVDALFARFFRDSAHHQVHASIASVVDTWTDAFSVQMHTPCTKGNFITAIESHGIASIPMLVFNASTPTVALLDDQTLMMSGTMRGHAQSVANAWFVEGVCVQKDCDCSHFPVQVLCDASNITLDFNFSYRVRVGLEPDSEGLLPLPIVESTAFQTTEYTNGCESVSPNATLPWFAQRFNDTFVDAMKKSFEVLPPRIASTIVDTLRGFVVNDVRGGLSRYLPGPEAFGVNFGMRYAVDSTTVRSSASKTSEVDPAATITWSASMMAWAEDMNGVTHYFDDGNGKVFNSSCAPSEGAFNASASATCLRMSGQLSQLLSWFSSMRDALNDRLNNTVLDADIETVIVMPTPLTWITQDFSNIPLVDKLWDAATVGKELREKGGDGGRAAVEMHIQSSQASVSCKNGSLSILDAMINNLTAITYLAAEFEDAGKTYRSGKVPEFPEDVYSLFLWIESFNDFEGATFDVREPTGGFPGSVLSSIMEKALKEGLPHFNAAYRKVKLPLPPAIQLLLRPLEGSNLQAPQTDVQKANETACASLLTFTTVRPDAPLPPSPPPSLDDQIPVILGELVPSPDGSSLLVTTEQRLRLSPRCLPMVYLNGTQRYWFAENFTYRGVEYQEGTSPRKTVTANALWPSAIKAFCNADCGSCLSQVDLNTAGGRIDDEAQFFGVNGTLWSLTVATPSVAEDTRFTGCVPGAAHRAFTTAAASVAYSSECGAASSTLPDLLALGPKSSSKDDPTVSCSQLPGVSRLSVVLFNSTVFLPCFACPGNDSIESVQLSCPAAKQVPVLKPGHGRCVDTQAGEFWVGSPQDIPQCPALALIPPPVPPPASLNLAVLLPVGVGCLLILLLAACVLIPRLRRRKNSREPTESSGLLPDNHREDSAAVSKGAMEERSDDEESEEDANFVKMPSSKHLSERYLARLNQPVIQPDRPTSSFSMKTVDGSSFALQDSALGASNELGEPVARIAPNVWDGVMLLVAGAVGGAGSLVLHFHSPFGKYTSEAAQRYGIPDSVNIDNLEASLDWWNQVMYLTLGSFAVLAFLLGFVVLIDSKARALLPTAVRSSAGRITSFVVVLFAIGFQFATVTPPVAFDVRSMAKVSLNSNVTTSIVSPTTLNEYATTAASIAASLATLPTVLHILNGLASAIPIAAGGGCALHAARIARVANIDITSIPVPVTWLMVNTLCGVTGFAVTLVLDFISFQATREFTCLCLCCIRSLLGLLSISATRYLCDAAAEANPVDKHRHTLRGNALAAFAMVADVGLTIGIAMTTSALPPGVNVAMHVVAVVLYTTFFASLPFGQQGKVDAEAPFSCTQKLIELVDPLERYSQPWWRMPFVIIAAVFAMLSFTETAKSAMHDDLRGQLIGYMKDNGIQFPSNISKVHLFVDPGIAAYQNAMKEDAMVVGVGSGLACLSCITSVLAVVVRNCLPNGHRRLTAVSRLSSIASYIVLLVAALYFTIPDFVSESNLEHVVPDCGPQFYRQGQLALRTFTQVFFSAVVFGRLLPLLITFPPAVVRVLYLVGRRCGIVDQFAPMLAATLVTVVSVQLPVTSIALAGDATSVSGIAIALPALLVVLVVVYHPAVHRHAAIVDVPLLWLIVYIVGWILLLWQAIVENERLWQVARHVFESEAMWYELFASVFLATVAFCDIVWLVANIQPASDDDSVGDAADYFPSTVDRGEEDDSSLNAAWNTKS